MTRDEIIRMAREADCFDIFELKNNDCIGADALIKFASLVAAAEREASARLCELKSSSKYFDRPQTPMDCANAIRARGQK